MLPKNTNEFGIHDGLSGIKGLLEKTFWTGLQFRVLNLSKMRRLSFQIYFAAIDFRSKFILNRTGPQSDTQFVANAGKELVIIPPYQMTDLFYSGVLLNL